MIKSFNKVPEVANELTFESKMQFKVNATVFPASVFLYAVDDGFVNVPTFNDLEVPDDGKKL